MFREEIDLNDLMDEVYTETSKEKIFALSTKSKKKLTYTTLTSIFKVYHNKQLIWEGFEPDIAVKEYNKI